MGLSAVYKSEVIDVRVSQRVLWVGAEAYPLHNIARARTVKVVPRPALSLYLGVIVLWIVLGIFLAGLLGFGLTIRHGLVVVLIAAIVGVITIKLLPTLSKTFYALIIETAGRPYSLLVSADETLVTRLVHQIMDAIDNPQTEFQLQVENVHIGDKIEQLGNQNIGKVSK